MRQRSKWQQTACATLLCVAASATARAQDPTPPPEPTFRAEVNIVEVVAVVTDEAGESLGDLTASDVEVLEDGERRELLSVRTLTSGTSEAGVVDEIAAGASGHVERLPTSTASADAPAFVLLLDDLDTSPRDAHRVIRAGERALTAIPGSALVAVLTTSGLGGSLLTLEPPGPTHVDRVRNFRGQLLLRHAINPRLPNTTPSSINAPCGVGSAVVDSLDCADPTRAARRADAVAAAAEILGRAGSRRKVLLWVTQTMGVSTLDPQGSRQAQRRALTAALNNDVAVFVLDPRENNGANPFDGNQGDESPDSRRSGGRLRAGTADTVFGGSGGMTMALDVDDMVAVPLTQITRETGGRYITMANNLGDLMGRIITQNATSYLLAYESPVSTTPGRHRIDVRVARPGARVSARRGYIVEAPSEEGESSDPSGSNELLRQTLLGSAPQGQLHLVVHAAPRFARGKAGTVSVSVVAQDRAGDLSSAVDVLLVTFDDDGRATNQHQVRLEPQAGRPLEFTTEFPLARGRHQLRVAAATADGTKTGLVITPVEVVEPGRDLVMTPPVVLQQVRDTVAPTASRRFEVGTPVGVQAEIGGRPVRNGGVSVQVTLADASGRIVRTSGATLDPGDAPDRQRATGVLATDGLAPGRYLLTVEAAASNATPTRHAIPLQLDAPASLDPAAPPSATGTATELRHLVVAYGPASRHHEPGTFVIRTGAEWQAFWRHLPTRQAAPDIDFSRATLFAVVGDGAGAGSGTPVVVSIREGAGETVVTWRTAPSPGPPTDRPFTVVALQGVASDPVRFVRTP